MALDFPNSPAINDTFTSGGTIWRWDGTKWVIGVVTAPVVVTYVPVNGRLTLTSGVPVMTADVSSAGTIYFTPYQGNRISLNVGGSGFVPQVFNELSLVLAAAAHLANTNYDLFVYSNAGTIQLVSGPAWTSAIARSAGGAISLSSGFYVNTGSMSAIASGNVAVTVPAGQGLYVGTFRTAAAGLTTMIMNPAGVSGGVVAVCGLWNYYNRRLLGFISQDTGAVYNYTSNVVRQARASANNQVNFVSGLAEDTIAVTHAATAGQQASGSQTHVGIGLDSTTTFYNLAFVLAYCAATATGSFLGAVSQFIMDKQIGFHVISRNEASDNITSNSFNNSSTDYVRVAHWC